MSRRLATNVVVLTVTAHDGRESSSASHAEHWWHSHFPAVQRPGGGILVGLTANEFIGAWVILIGLSRLSGCPGEFNLAQTLEADW